MTFRWDTEEIERMAVLWNKEGLSAAQIAARYGVTRNSVIGITARNRDIFKARGTPIKRFTDQQKREAHIARLQKSRESRRELRKVELARKKLHELPVLQGYKIHTLPYDEARIPHAKTLLDLGNCECKWPLNGEGKQLFCAEETSGRKPYCEHHTMRAKGEGTRSERRAA